MGKMNIAIVGLGRVGTEFLKTISGLSNKGVEVVAASEINESEGTKLARDKGIKLITTEEIVALKDKVDIIFDLTGNDDVRKELRETLAASNNTHTVIAPETIAQLLWLVLTGKSLPDVHTEKGY